MSEEERAALLYPRRGPARLTVTDYRSLGVSPGGGSWHRRLTEYAEAARSPPDAAACSLDTGTRRARSRPVSVSKPEEDPARRPYHYSQRSQTNLAEPTPLVGQLEADPVEVAHYRRYQYYTRLQNQTGQNLDLLNIPDHVVPASFYQIHLPGVSTVGKQSSLVTIFAIWNTMMGTSLLSMPWALQQAGLVMGLAMMVAVSGVCLYTAYRILQSYSLHSRTCKISEFGDLCGLLLGRWAELLATAFSVLAVLGAAIVYWVLMSNFLFNTVQFIHDEIVGTNDTDTGVYCPKNTSEAASYMWDTELWANSTEEPSTMELVWGQFTTVPLFLILFLFPLINLKSATFFTKFNALGTVSILFILISVLYRCYEWGIHASFEDPADPEYVPLFMPSFPSLTGILALGLFIHNAIITIMTNNRNQEKNGRDMSIAYLLVTATYMIIGAAFYLAFPLPKDCIEDNLLNNFHSHDGLTVAAKIFLFFQMTTVFPLIMYLLRVAIMYPIYRTVFPGYRHILALNTVIVLICVLFAIFLPKIGTIIRFSGAACGLVMVFLLPCLVHMASLKKVQGSLSSACIAVHALLIALGTLNFAAQFFV